MQPITIEYKDSYTQPIVLIVDDNAMCRKIVGKMLAKLNIQAMEADSALTAFELISCKSFAMVLMDLHMPDIDGIEATSFIRNLNHQYFKDLPIIGFSAHREEELREIIKNSGITDYISKPFTPEDIKNKLSKFNLLEVAA